MEGCPTRGRELILLGWGATSVLSRGAYLAACWLHEPQPVNGNRVGLGFPHFVGGYRPGGSAYTSPGSCSLRDEEVFLTRRWELTLPGVAGPRRYPEWKLSPRASSMSLSQLPSRQLGCGFHTLRGGIDPGVLSLHPRVVGVVEIWKDVRTGDGNSSSSAAARPRCCPAGHISPRDGSMSFSQLT